MARNLETPLTRNEESFRYITSKVREIQTHRASVEKQQETWDAIGKFFAPEIEAMMNYTGKLPSFRDCGGANERKELLKQEAELLIWEHLIMNQNQVHDFEEAMQGFRDAISTKLREYTQQAQRESVHVAVKQNKKTNENEKCTIISGKKDITAAATNPNFENEEPSEAPEDFMDRTMGPYQAL